MKNKKYHFPTSTQEIKSLLDHYQIKKYTINYDLSVSVDGDVDLSYNKLNSLPLKFKVVTGKFDCRDNSLTTLEGSPEQVDLFNCGGNKLKSLKGGPVQANIYYCQRNKLTDLSYLPTKSLTDLFCGYNQITSLRGVPDTVKILWCNQNQINSLSDCPPNLEVLKMSSNNLECVDFNYKIKKIEQLDVSFNKIKTLKNIKVEITKDVFFLNNPIPLKEIVELCEIKYPEQWNSNVSTQELRKMGEKFLKQKMINDWKKQLIILERL